VALKALRPTLWIEADEAAARRRHLAEALHPLLCLRHPNLAAVHEIVEHNETLFVVRDMARGTSLRTILERRGMLTDAEAAALTGQASEVLDALAGVGIAHGAVTSDNLFLDEKGTLRLTDAAFSAAAGTLTLAGVDCRRQGRMGDRAAFAAL